MLDARPDVLLDSSSSESVELVKVGLDSLAIFTYFAVYTSEFYGACNYIFYLYGLNSLRLHLAKLLYYSL